MAGVVSIAGATSGIAAPLSEGVTSAAYQPLAVPRRKLDALTALRFPASAFAVIGHTYSTFRFGIVFWAAFTLNQGVSFFFILSGFILAYVYPSLNLPGTARFLVARFARIWPLHVIALLFAFFILPASLYPEGRGLGAMLLNLSLTQNWGFASPASVNPVAWSLSVEFFFYLCFPLLIWRWRQTWAIKLGLTALITCAGLLYIEHRIHGPLHWPIVNFESASLNPPVRLFEFALGMATALLFRYLAPRVALRRWQGTLVEISVVGLCGYVMYHSAAWAEQITHTHWNVATDIWAAMIPRASWIGTTASWWIRSSGVTCLPFAALILVMALERGWIARLLRWSPFVLLGEISYAIYLTHSTVLLFWSTHAADLLTISPPFRYAAYWAAVLLISYVFWALVEVPCRQAILTRWDRRFPDGRQVPISATPTTGRTTPRRWRLSLTNPSWRSCVLIVVIGLFVGSSIHSATSPPSLQGYVSHPEAALFQVENIGGYRDEQLGRPIGLPRFAFPSGTVQVTGWAADLERRGPVRGVYIVIDDTPMIWAGYGYERPDIARLLRTSRYLASGYSATIPLDRLTNGMHTLTIKVVFRGSERYADSQRYTLVVA